MSDHERPATVYDDPDMEYYEDAPPVDTLPVRPRRKLLTPVSGGLLAIVLVAGGFIGGVQVQKHQGNGTNNGAARNGLPAAFAARLAQGGGGTRGGVAAPGAARAGGGSGGATAGTVANVKGSTLYVTGANGATVKVKTNDNSKVTRDASSSVGSVHPGDTVVVQGSTASSGTVTASSIIATATGVVPSGFGGAFPGAGAGGGAASATGTAPESGGSAPQVPQGFTPPSG
jgi:hypothetical protein